MKYKKCAIFLLFFLSFLPSCTTQKTSEEEKKTFRYVNLYRGQNNYMLLDKMKTLFEKTYPNYELEIIDYTHNDVIFAYSNLLEAGKPIHLIGTSFDLVEEFFQADAILPVDDFLVSDSEIAAFHEQMQPKSLTDLVEFEKTLYAYPAWQNTYILYYNKIYFKRAGVALPRGNESFQDILDKVERVSTYISREDAFDVLPFLVTDMGLKSVYGQYGFSFDKPLNRLHLPVTLTHLRELKSAFYPNGPILLTDYIRPISAKSIAKYELFEQGRFTMFFGGTWQNYIFNQKGKDWYGYLSIPIPQSKIPTANIVVYWMLPVATFPDAVQDDARFLLRFFMKHYDKFVSESKTDLPIKSSYLLNLSDGDSDSAKELDLALKNSSPHTQFLLRPSSQVNPYLNAMKQYLSDQMTINEYESMVLENKSSIDNAVKKRLGK